MSDNTLNPSLVERAVKRLRDKIQQRTDLQDLKLMVDSWYALAHENADLLVAVKRMNEAMVEAERDLIAWVREQVSTLPQYAAHQADMEKVFSTYWQFPAIREKLIRTCLQLRA